MAFKDVQEQRASVVVLDDEEETEITALKSAGIPSEYVECKLNPVQTTNFSMAPSNSPIDLSFDDVTFTAESGWPWKKEYKEILHSINGRFPAGQLVAIMGPSGAGKSTLLNVLSGYSKTGIGGTVSTNGLERDLDQFRRMSCYITQDDRLQPLLTVEENMSVAADLKLGPRVSRRKKNGIIDEILRTLGLAKARTTRTARLSGGQKKRLSIALELVNNPLVLFLDEPTTGLDSSSCTQCVKLLQVLARQGRTIVCTIHQPSASLFQLFDQVYVLSSGRCLYQGSTENLVPFLEEVGSPCPQYHNPADYVIELACGEYGEQIIDLMVKATDNGKCLTWMKDFDKLPDLQSLRCKELQSLDSKEEVNIHASSSCNQLKILLSRGFLKAKRDSTLTYMRIGVNILVSLMLGSVYWQAGSDGGKVLDNYNLLFSILMHHMMSTMMLTILTFPTEMSILIKEHFNRWYSLKMYYAQVTIVDLPIAIVSSVLFSAIIYYMTGQPPEWTRFSMFTAISVLTVFVAQSFGLMIGGIFDVVNGTFLGPTLSVPMMMFAGFGVTLKDLPSYLYWGSYISYLRYGLEGVVGAIYGMDRATLDCPDGYCHFKYPTKFLEVIDMRGNQFWNDIIALTMILFVLRIVAYYCLRWKLNAVR